MGSLIKGKKTAPPEVGAWMEQMRQAMFDTATPNDVVETFRKLRELAMGGDLAAMKLWLAYMVGPPGEPPAQVPMPRPEAPKPVRQPPKIIENVQEDGRERLRILDKEAEMGRKLFETKETDNDC